MVEVVFAVASVAEAGDAVVAAVGVVGEAVVPEVARPTTRR